MGLHNFATILNAWGMKFSIDECISYDEIGSNISSY